MRVDWKRTVAPTTEPLTVAEAKRHCRGLMDITDEDSLFEQFIPGAREVAEEFTSRGFFTQTWKYVQDDFTNEMWLPRAAPVQSVTHVKYYDVNGTLQTLSTDVYRLDDVAEPARVVLKPDQSWPSVQSDRGQAVEITYVCGWSTTAAIPASIKVGIALIAGHLYENRGTVAVGVGVGAVELPLSAKWFLSPHCVEWRAPVCQ